MKIIRDGKEILLTNDELYEAHKVFVTQWMKNTVMEEILSLHADYNLLDEDYQNIAERAYDIYTEGNGLTEYESVSQAIDEFTEKYDVSHDNELDEL